MPRTKAEPLNKFYNEDSEILEIGIDEAGRGPLFGRVYTGAVILPKDVDFEFDKMKDSKKFSSVKKINEVAEYIKEKALAWSVTYNDEKVVDNINIRQSVLSSMEELCEENPELKERYGIDKNKGYGTKTHLDGIKNFGITKWHRKTYGICKDYC